MPFDVDDEREEESWGQIRTEPADVPTATGQLQEPERVAAGSPRSEDHWVGRD